MARRTFRQHVVDISPTVMLGDISRRFFGGAFALMADALASWSVQSGRATSFSDPNQPTDALSMIGEERLSPRYAIDTDVMYKARLKDAWNRWLQGGSELGMLAELAAFGITAHTKLDNDWDWDGTAYWSRFWVVVTSHPWTEGPELGDPGLVLDGTWTFGSSATPEEVDTVRKIVRRWKPGHMICLHIVIVFDLANWNSDQPDGTWGDLAERNNDDACYWPG